MMHDRDEWLSRYLLGDLTDEERARVEERLDGEPEWAAALDRMSDTLALLETLPDEVPPASLDAEVLAYAEPSSGVGAASSGYGWRAAAMAAVVCVAVGVGTLLQPSPAVHTLVEGMQRVDGVAEVVAGDVHVAVDGIAEIRREPAPRVMRVHPQTEDNMDARSTGLGALGGALVSVVVLQGSAWVTAGGGDAVEVSAGETHQVGSTQPMSATGRSVVRRDPTASLEQQVAQLEQENQQLRDALNRSEFEGAVARGQLNLHQGEASEWPAQVPAGFEPDAMRARIEAALESEPGLELAELDCAEYPCVALLSHTQPVEGWEKLAADVPKQMAEGMDDVGLSVMVAAMEGDDGAHKGLVGFSMTPKQDLEATGTRTAFRTEQLLDDHMGGGPDGMDEDVFVPGH